LNELMTFHFRRMLGQDPGACWEQVRQNYAAINGTELQNAELNDMTE
jgi:hypothetical protein